MKDRLAAMSARAVPATAPRLPHLQRKHAVVLVLGVLLLHVWILAGTPMWFSAEPSQPLHPQALITRQIEVAAPRAPQVPQAARAPSRAEAPATEADTTAEAKAKQEPLKFDEFGADLASPLALPARSASGVDLPPFQRTAGVDGMMPTSDFKAPESAKLKYQVQGKIKGLDYWASAELLWLQDGKDYEARLEVGAFLLGSRTQFSKGTLGRDGLMPTRFGDKGRSEQAAHFQRDKGIISFSANSPDVALLRGAQDRLSVVLQLSSLLAADPTRFPPGTMLSFQTASHREAEVWQFLVEKDELLQLPFGELNALKLIRQPRRQFDQRIELWFSPNLGYLPVRLLITNANGDSIDQLLSKAEKPSP